ARSESGSEHGITAHLGTAEHAHRGYGRARLCVRPSAHRRMGDHGGGMAGGRADGMTTMEQSLADLVKVGRITRETAYAHGYRTDDLQRYLGERAEMLGRTPRPTGVKLMVR